MKTEGIAKWELHPNGCDSVWRWTLTSTGCSTGVRLEMQKWKGPQQQYKHLTDRFTVFHYGDAAIPERLLFGAFVKANKHTKHHGNAQIRGVRMTVASFPDGYFGGDVDDR